MPASATLTTAAIRDHYDSFAWIYRVFWGEHIHHGFFSYAGETPEQAQVNLLRHCARLGNVQRNIRVLDVGCGNGGTCVYLARRFGCHAEGISLSQTQVAIAQANARRAGVEALTRFIVSDAEAHSFDREAIDLVWTMESSEHFWDKAGYFRRAADALRPGGQLLLAAWTGSMESQIVSSVAETFLCPYLQTSEDYARQVEDAGLRIREVQNITPQVTRTWQICLTRSHKLRALWRAFPKEVRSFIDGMRMIFEAYQSGALTYHIIVAMKR
jgi:tocopherol O-methyltransferase